MFGVEPSGSTAIGFMVMIAFYGFVFAFALTVLKRLNEIYSRIQIIETILSHQFHQNQHELPASPEEHTE
jgi:hypothetical protein